MITSAVDNINTATGKKVSGVSQNYEDFLRLLTTQLQNQDPTAPQDTNQLTQQIATLSQVEQQLKTNDNLDRLINLFSATQNNSLVSYIGKDIEAEGDLTALNAGKGEFSYYLEREADKVQVTIKDEAGNVVYTGSGTTLAGRNEFTWDGKNQAGEQMPDGIYKTEVKALDGSNNDILSKTYVKGTVTSIDNSAGVIYLSIEELISVPLEKIISVRQAPNQV